MRCSGWLRHQASPCLDKLGARSNGPLLPVTLDGLSLWADTQGMTHANIFPHMNRSDWHYALVRELESSGRWNRVDAQTWTKLNGETTITSSPEYTSVDGWETSPEQLCGLV